jgi:hypothetical protein
VAAHLFHPDQPGNHLRGKQSQPKRQTISLPGFTAFLQHIHSPLTALLHNRENSLEDVMNPISKKFSFVLFLVLFLTSACKANISRNSDGTLNVETSITQQQLQDVISASIADPLIKDLTVSLQSGYVLVSGTRERLNDPTKTDTLSFRLGLSVNNGQLASVISNAQLDGVPLEQNRVDHWNETIVNRLSMLGGKKPNSTLKSVVITSEAVTMNWTVARQ